MGVHPQRLQKKESSMLAKISSGHPPWPLLLFQSSSPLAYLRSVADGWSGRQYAKARGSGCRFLVRLCSAPTALLHASTHFQDLGASMQSMADSSSYCPLRGHGWWTAYMLMLETLWD